MSLEQKPKFKRQSKIDIELGVALSDEGLRLTVFSPRLTTLANLILEKSMIELDNGNQISRELQQVRQSLIFTNESYNGCEEKINKLITTNQIPNMKFLITNDSMGELIINDVFCNFEIQQWIKLFSKFVLLMKKINKDYGLLN
jgi:hypothetical protein